MSEEYPKLLRARDAAKYLGVSIRTLWRCVARGLKTVKIGRCTRFALADLNAFIAPKG